MIGVLGSRKIKDKAGRLAGWLPQSPRPEMMMAWTGVVAEESHTEERRTHGFPGVWSAPLARRIGLDRDGDGCGISWGGEDQEFNQRQDPLVMVKKA